MRVVNKAFLLRLFLDFAAVGLLLVALAYYWSDNVVHEWIGTGIFALILLHNGFNRRWYGRVAKTPPSTRSALDLGLTFGLLVAMLVLLASSLTISQTVFGFLKLGGGFTARQVHSFAAYWAVVLVSLHLGLRWQRVMNAMRVACRINQSSATRTTVLRLMVAAIAVYGIHSLSVMGVGTKLSLQMSLDGWDFDTAAAAYFMHWASIVGLFASLTYYLARWLPARPIRSI